MKTSKTIGFLVQIYYCSSGKWKLRGKELYDLHADISESKNLAKDNPEVVARLSKMLSDFKAEVSKNRRPAGGPPKAPRKKKKK